MRTIARGLFAIAESPTPPAAAPQGEPVAEVAVGFHGQGVRWLGAAPLPEGTKLYVTNPTTGLRSTVYLAPTPPAAAEGALTDERQAFEQWWRSVDDGTDSGKGAAWLVWQARAALSAAPAPATAWENFPAYLIDHCEGETISEEGLQRALADMLSDPKYAPTPAPEASDDHKLREQCFACGEPIKSAARAVWTRDPQRQFVGLDCFRKVAHAGAEGYQPDKGGPRLFKEKP
jgi:hypothetical protein